MISLADGIEIDAGDISFAIGKAIEVTIDLVGEQLVEDVADKLLENVHEQIKSGKFQTHGGKTVYGFFDTGRFSTTIDSVVVKDDVAHRSIHVGSTSKVPNPNLVEFGYTTRNVEVRELRLQAIIDWVIRKRIAKGKTAVMLGKKFHAYIQTHGISPRPIFRNAKRKTESVFEQIATNSAEVVNLKVESRIKQELSRFSNFVK